MLAEALAGTPGSKKPRKKKSAGEALQGGDENVPRSSQVKQNNDPYDTFIGPSEPAFHHTSESVVISLQSLYSYLDPMNEGMFSLSFFFLD